MKKIYLISLPVLCSLCFCLLHAQTSAAGDGRGGRGRGGGFTGPSASVRPPDRGLARASALNLLGWRVGMRTDASNAPTFSDAAARVDAAGLAFVEGVAGQKWSADSPAVLEPDLAAEDIGKIRSRLNELRLRMPVYSAGNLPSDAASLRKLFGFAKTLGVDTVEGTPAPQSALAELDRLANEFGINVAIVSGNPNTALAPLQGLSGRIGLSVDLAEWRRRGFKPAGAATRIKDRLLIARLHGGEPDNSAFLLQLSRLQPPAAPPDYPPPPGKDGGGARAEGRALFFALDAGTAAALDTELRAAIQYRVDELAKLTPISTPEKIPEDQRRRIDAAVPRHAPATPGKPRKLLIMDLVLNGSFYHGSIPLANFALGLMSKYTGAFTVQYSNDLNNLKYPAIRQFDGVFLNGIQGDVFEDRDAIEGLTRYVREGGGVTGLHAATWASQDVPAFGELMGATSGAHKYNGEPGALRIDDPDSPLMKQFGRGSFEFLDEFYHYIPTGPYSREELHVLMSLDPERKDLPGNQYTTRPDNDYGMVWIRSYGKGRVFNVGLGHRPEFYEDRRMLQMVLAGIQFIVGDLKADTTPSARLAGK